MSAFLVYYRRNNTLAEIWELLDENGSPTGIKYERGSSVPIPKGLYHIAVEVWVKTADGLLLLTKRQKGRKRELQWEPTCGSAIWGETSLETAQRELIEEIGITVPLSEIELFGRIKAENCLVDVYGVKLPLPASEVKLTLQEEEVADSQFVEIDAVTTLGLEYTDSFKRHFPMYVDKLKAK